MATFTLNPQQPVPSPINPNPPISYGDNTIISNYYTSRWDNPQWTAEYGDYLLTYLDFSTDTFPQYIASNPSMNLQYIKITELNLPSHIKLLYPNGSLVNVNDIINIRNDSLILRNSFSGSSLGFAFGNFKVIPIDDSSALNESVIITMNVMDFPMRKNISLKFRAVGNHSVPKNTIYTIPISAFTSDFTFIGDSSLPYAWAPEWQQGYLYQYLQQYGNIKPFKVEAYEDVDPRVTFLGKPIVKGQKMSISLIQSGQLRVNTYGLENPIEMIIRFGDAYYGSFRLIQS